VVRFSYDWKGKAARQNLRRGIQLNPSDPMPDSIRSGPRFLALLHRINLSQQSSVARL
jgi:hypothetical protein